MGQGTGSACRSLEWVRGQGQPQCTMDKLPFKLNLWHGDLEKRSCLHIHVFDHCRLLSSYFL